MIMHRACVFVTLAATITSLHTCPKDVPRDIVPVANKLQSAYAATLRPCLAAPLMATPTSFEEKIDRDAQFWSGVLTPLSIGSAGALAGYTLDDHASHRTGYGALCALIGAYATSSSRLLEMYLYYTVRSYSSRRIYTQFHHYLDQLIDPKNPQGTSDMADLRTLHTQYTTQVISTDAPACARDTKAMNLLDTWLRQHNT